jgi:hypothetical protein
MNSEIPLTPAGPPGTFASTRWTMFSLSSCSPPEIHIFVPNRRYVPSACGSARVVMSANDDPACVSLRHIVPKKRPSTIGATQVSICSREPLASNRFAAPTVRKG